jgi:hypothetical protein
MLAVLMLARLLHLHPKTHSRLVRLSREAERDGLPGGETFAGRCPELGRPHERGTGGDSESAAVQGIRVVVALSDVRSGWTTGGIPVWTTAAVDSGATGPSRRHSGEWSGSVRFGYGPVELPYAGLGDRGGVRRGLPSGARAEAAAQPGLLRAAAAARAGAGRCGGAGPVAPAGLPQP